MVAHQSIPFGFFARAVGTSGFFGLGVGEFADAALGRGADNCAAAALRSAGIKVAGSTKMVDDGRGVGAASPAVSAGNLIAALLDVSAPP